METIAHGTSSGFNLPLSRTRIVSRAEAASLAYTGIWSDTGSASGRAAVCLMDAELIEIASGVDGVCDRIDALPFGVRRLSVAFGAVEQLRHADIGPMFSLVRLCAGPIGRVLRELDTERLTIPSPLSRTIAALSSALGYAERGVTKLDRPLFHALVPDVLATPQHGLRRLGVERRDAPLLGPTLVTIDALADLLGVPSISLSACGVVDRRYWTQSDARASDCG
jgi:hypothetical protein